MLTTFIVGVVGLAAGFGVGRIKNLAKLSAIEALVTKEETAAVTEVKLLIVKVKALL